MDVPRSQFTHDRFYDWKHASDQLGVHEQSKDQSHQAILSATSHEKKSGRIYYGFAQEGIELSNISVVF